MTTFRICAALAASVLAAESALAVTYSFDTVTAVTLNQSNARVVGVERNTGKALSVSFVDNTNVNFRYVVNRCVPVFLTAMEKPGRYFLHVEVDPAATSVGLIGCSLEVKS